MYPVSPLWQPYTCFMGILSLQSSNHIYWIPLHFFIPDKSYWKPKVIDPVRVRSHHILNEKFKITNNYVNFL